jgi:hypothetical protein
MLIFTTATYDESPYMDILSGILKDESMLDSRADPAVLWSLLLHPRCRRLRRMSLYFETTHAGELPDPFTIDPEVARQILVCYWNCVISPYGPENIRP